MPVYLVTVAGEKPEKKMVDAPNQRAAVNHVIRGKVKAEALSASEVAKHMKDGVGYEAANANEASE